MQSDPNFSKKAGSWDSYWQSSAQAAAYSSEGNSHPATSGFWSKFFGTSIPLFEGPRVIDLASGSAAVVSHALAAPGGYSAEFTCVDISERAIAGIRERFPHVRTIATDAADTGLPPHAFDIVTSQFGIEYAGSHAFKEAVRLLASNGRLACLLHHAGGSIHSDCIAGLDAVKRVREARFIPLAIDFFSAGFDAVRSADRAPYEQAASLLNPAVRALEDVVNDHGPDVAGGVIARLYNDANRMHRHIQRYEPSEVLDWLQNMNLQFEDYVNRISAMSAAALDEKDFEGICNIVSAAGCTVLQSGPLFAPGVARPLAWALLASR